MIMNLSRIELNKSTSAEVNTHLTNCDEYFTPRLSSYTNIGKYSEKLVDKAMRLELWQDLNVIGLLAYYKKEDSIFISSLSVEHEYQKKSFGVKLLMFLIEKYKQSKISKITLEVYMENEKALKFYKLNDFQVVKAYDNKFLLNFNYD